MFSAIARRYDFLNRLLSCGFDRSWRRAAVDALDPEPGEVLLDMATGTADVALEIVAPHRPQSPRVIGVDFSRPMLDRARRKISRRSGNSLIQLAAGAAECLPFIDDCLDGAVAAFGLRNFADPRRGLDELHRTLKPGGRLVILEFSLPPARFLRTLYQVYFNEVLPRVGKLVSRHGSAYRYLPASVSAFPHREALVDWLEASGFQRVCYQDLTGGVVTLYSGINGDSPGKPHPF